MHSVSRSLLASLVACTFAVGCASTPPPPPPPPPEPVEPVLPPGAVSLLEYEAKTKELLDATAKLDSLRDNVDEQQRRLTAICVDYPDHIVCSEQTSAAFARKSFCEDQNFTGHVDQIVSSCHQGQCKQVDEAEMLSRTQYMTLIQRLPHKLVLFKSAKSNLDRTDRAELQRFVEAIRADQGYIIIVGRASKEGPWRDNLRYALDRAESTRRYLVDDLGIDSDKVGYITYGHDKMYLTEVDASRLSEKKLGMREANRSALVFTYPCHSN